MARLEGEQRQEQTLAVDGGARVARINVPVPDAIQSEYEAHVMPALVAITRDWWTQYAESDRSNWDVRASSDGGADKGIYIDAPDDDPQDAICCPRWLNDATLLIGWQKYRNASIRDPKREIAEKLIEALLRSELLAAHVDIEHMDDVAEDLGLYQQGSDYESDDDDRNTDDCDGQEDKDNDDKSRENRENGYYDMYDDDKSDGEKDGSGDSAKATTRGRQCDEEEANGTDSGGSSPKRMKSSSPSSSE
ncbi:hypothetical protein Gpo141_00009476 [Globisporangium polare]